MNENTDTQQQPQKRGLFGLRKKESEDICERVVKELVKEQRRARRWRTFFTFLAFAYLFLLLFMLDPDFSSGVTKKDEKHTAVIQVNGVISADSDASADKIVTGLRNAFKDENTAGIILRINSPGGSPVQAGYVNDEILRLREEYPDTPLYAVVSDLCASGGYYIAAAADKIYADKSSIVGSIGVLMNGFGFVDALDKLGVERRLLTAGQHKGMLDPFSPIKADEQEHVQSLLDNIHEQFINAVKEGRGDRLKNDPQLFSGLYWTGEQAMENGLVDELGSSSYVAREVFKAEKIVDFTHKRDYLERFAERFGAAFADVVVSKLGGSGELR